MAKLTRVLQKLFGSTAGADAVGKFGSFAAGTPESTTNPLLIQSYGAFLGGWQSAILGDNAPCIEDQNALDFLWAYQIAYLMQAGIPEWDATTTYYIGSLVNDTGVIYKSLTDTNLNNAVSDTTKWKVMCNNPFTTLGDTLYALANGVPARLAGNTTTTRKFQSQTGNGTISAAPVWDTIVSGDLDAVAQLARAAGVAVHGTNTNDSAAAGYIGEYMESLTSSPTNYGTSGVLIDAGSLALTAGDWDISIVATVISGAAASITTVAAGISSTSGNTIAGLTKGVNYCYNDYSPALGNTANVTLVLPPFRVSINASTTYYLKLLAIWATTQPTYTCRISARRVR